MHTNQINGQKGFTLIELMIVVAIIGILAAIAIPQFKKFTIKSKRAEAYEVLSAIGIAQMSFYSSFDIYAYDTSVPTLLDKLGLNGVVKASNSQTSQGYQISFADSTQPGTCLTKPNQCYFAMAEQDFDDDPSVNDMLVIKSEYFNDWGYNIPANIPVLNQDDITHTVYFF